LVQQCHHPILPHFLPLLALQVVIWTGLVIAGPDANRAPGVPAQIPHGKSLHDKLELLFDAGLSTVDALQAATLLPAKYFGLHDRGVIKPGRLADLVCLTADPTEDIGSTCMIEQVWCGGVNAFIRTSYATHVAPSLRLF
jgi:Amidohydrolase family